MTLDFIKKNFVNLIVLLLVLFLFIERCSQKPIQPQEPVIIRDTVYVEKTGSINTTPHLTGSIPIPMEKITKEISYLPDTNYNKLLKQYNKLLSLYFTKNVQKDTLKIDSIGSVYVTDTVSQNMVSARLYQYDLDYPVITKTVTLPCTPRNQIYIGGGIGGGNTVGLINNINAGFLLKNKRDQIFGVYAGIDKNINVTYGVQSYWKIRLRK